MVRFIINELILGYNPVYEIYIPIWLDLLYFKKERYCRLFKNLHSNMVRFIIIGIIFSYFKHHSFTFQYG